MNKPLINGIAYSWANIVFNIAGVDVSGISAIKYDDNQEKVNNYGAGSNVTSRSYGKYEATASVTLHADEIEAITAAAPNRKIQDIPPFNIIVTFMKPDGTGTVSHSLRNVEFVNNGRDLSNGSTLIETELELVLTHIEW